MIAEWFEELTERMGRDLHNALGIGGTNYLATGILGLWLILILFFIAFILLTIIEFMDMKEEKEQSKRNKGEK